LSNKKGSWPGTDRKAYPGGSQRRWAVEADILRRKELGHTDFQMPKAKRHYDDRPRY